MLPYAGNTRKDICLCWEPAGVWNESSSSWILCSVARRMLRQLQSCIEFLDRSFCLCSALGSLCFSRVSNPKCWATQRAAPSCWHPSNKNSSYLVSQKVIANKWVWKRLQKKKTFLPVCQSAPRLVLVERLLGRFLVRNWVFNLMIECSTAVPARDTARAQSWWYTAQRGCICWNEGR